MSLGMQQNYRGWTITFDARRPATGVWRAIRFGVSISAGTKTALKSMIDTRIYLRQQEKADVEKRADCDLAETGGEASA